MRGNLLSLLASVYLCHGVVILGSGAVANGRERVLTSYKKLLL